MKTSTFLCLIITILLNNDCLNAQSTETPARHHINVMVSDGLTLDILHSFTTILSSTAKANEKKIGDEMNSSSGMWAVRYHYDVNNFWSLGGEVGYQRQSTEQTLENQQTQLRRNEEMLTNAYLLMGYAKLNYYTNQSGRFQIYGNLSAGVLLLDSSGSEVFEDASDAYVAFQLNPIGVSYGGALSGFLEAGFGYKGFLTIGLSYAF